MLTVIKRHVRNIVNTTLIGYIAHKFNDRFT